METEKNKIEFWYEGNDVVMALMNNKTNEMMTKLVEISIKIAYTTRENKKGGFGKLVKNTIKVCLWG